MRFSLLNLAAALALAGCGTVLLPPNVAPVAPPATSTAQADAMLARAARERAEAEARFAASEQLCHARFFVNSCLDKAKDERRERLAQIKAVEYQAEYFQRKTKVEERDRKLAQAEREFQQDEARRAAEPVAPVKVEEALPAPRGRLAQRQAARAQKVAAQQAEDRQRAAQAPANVAAFERRKAESLERQRKVAQRQAERARRKAEEDARKAAEQKAADDARAKAATSKR